MIEAKTTAKAQLLQAYAPFKLAQRILAAMFATTFLVCFFTAAIMAIFGVGDFAKLKAVMDEFYIAEIMMTIIVFYFGGGFLEGTINSAKGKPGS